MTMALAIFTEELVCVLQRIALHQRTGLLCIECGGELGDQREQGEIFFEHGNPVFVQAEQELGEIALSRIMSWRKAHYTFREGTLLPASMNKKRLPGLAPQLGQMREIPSSKEAMEQNTPSLGMPALPRSIRPIPKDPVKAQPPVSSFPFISPSPPIGIGSPLESEDTALLVPLDASAIFRATSHVSLSEVPGTIVLESIERRDRAVFLLLNGKRTILDVARVIQRSELDVARTLARLLKRRYVEYVTA